MNLPRCRAVRSRNPGHRGEQRTASHEPRDRVDLILIEPNATAGPAAIEGKFHEYIAFQDAVTFRTA
jgi:hypothetical protein